MMLGNWGTSVKLAEQARQQRETAAPTGPTSITGNPVMPTFQTPLAPGGGLQQQYKLGTAPWNLMNQDINRLRQMAMSNAPSPMYQTQMNLLGGQADAARQSLLQQGAGAYASSLGQIAGHGGLAPGASERLSQNMMNQRLLGMQDIGRQQAAGALQLGLGEQQQKYDLLRGLPGMSQAYAGGITGIGQANQAAALQSLAQANAFDLNRFQTQMQALGAERTAGAMESGGGSSGGLFGQILKPFFG